MGELTTRIYVSASRLTYHVSNLEAAQLLVRRRQGNTVWICRTEMGDRLVAMMG